jgi:hypothetical protein
MRRGRGVAYNARGGQPAAPLQKVEDEDEDDLVLRLRALGAMQARGYQCPYLLSVPGKRENSETT